MSPAEKAPIVAALTKTARDMMLAGIRHRHPAAGEREGFLRAAIIQFGQELAVAAYPDDGDALRRAVRTCSSANLIHHESQIKVDLFVAGGTPLDAQWRDIAGIVRVQAGRLDRDYLRANAGLVEVADLLQRALADR